MDDEQSSVSIEEEDDQNYSNRKFRDKNKKIFYTIEDDLNILSNPQKDLIRYYTYLYVVKEKDKKLIKEYIEKYGSNAYLDFHDELVLNKTTNQYQKFRRFIGIKDVYEKEKIQVKQEEDNGQKQISDEKQKYRVIERKKRMKKIQQNISQWSELDSIQARQNFFNELSIQHKIPVDQILHIFEKVSQNYSDLMDAIERNKDYLIWEKEDDKILKEVYSHYISNEPLSQDLLMKFKLIERYKKCDRVLKRISYLNQNKEDVQKFDSFMQNLIIQVQQ